MRRGLSIALLFSLLFSFTAVTTTAQEASPEAASSSDGLLAAQGFPELAYTTDGEQLEGPTEIEAGRYHLILENTGEDLLAALELYQLPEGMTGDDLAAAMNEEMPPEWFFSTPIGGGVSIAEPGGSDSVIVDITPGEWVFNLYTWTPDYSEDTNMPVDVTVTGEMPGTLDEPEAAVEATMVDFDFEISSPVPAGANIWKVTNDGEQPHHLILSQVPDGTTEDDVIELVNAMFGPPPASPEAMATPVETALSFEDVVDVYDTLILSSGNSLWAEIDLEPGTYAAICFIPTSDGTPHIMLGMIEMLTVE